MELQKKNKIEINISILPEKEKQELMIFYKYLLFKSKIYNKNYKSEILELPKTFYSPIAVENYIKFDRDEIYRNK